MSEPAFPAIDYRSRLHRLRELAELDSGTALYVADLTNIRYLCGFAGSAGVLLVRAESAALVADGRYEELARETTAEASVEVVPIVARRSDEAIAGALRGITRLLIDPRQLTLDRHDELAKALPGVELGKARGLPERLRLVKDDAEIARIGAAARIAQEAFFATAPLLAERPTELEFASELETRMKKLGAEGIAFPSIVASGENSSKPHAHPGARVIGEGEPVIVDFGALVDGYHSDITRTVWVGEPAPRFRPIIAAAHDAYTSGVGAIRDGVTHASIDRACRDAMIRHGFTDPPLHPSGHSVGLAIHERPYLSEDAGEPVGTGYVVTVEPGVYVPGVGGARVEDTILVGEDGPRVLSAGKPARPVEGIGGLLAP
ncbi:Xaa-Pro peptidase family protein [Saccharomonospora sp. NPDC006951]